MKFCTVAFLFCFLISAKAQFGGYSTDQPFLSNSGAGGVAPNLQNVAYRWVASDVSNSTVSTWTDRIQGATFEQGEVAARPTASSNYISIDATHWLTNTVLPYSNTNLAFGLIINMSAASFTGTQPGIWMSDPAGACSDAYVGLCLNGTITYGVGMRPGCAPTSTLTPPRFGDLTNTPIDFIINQTWTGESPNDADYRTITNGVVCGIFQRSFLSLLASPLGPSDLGLHRFRGTHTIFKLHELWVWTNGNVLSTNSLLSANIIAAFHNYRVANYP